MKTGYWRQNEDCHDYFIPVNMISEWEELAEKMQGYEGSEAYAEEYQVACEDFDMMFGIYRINRYELTRAPIVIWEDEDFKRTKDGDLNDG